MRATSDARVVSASADFDAERQRALAAYRRLIESGAPREILRSEIDGTVSAMRQLVELRPDIRAARSGRAR